MSAGKFNNRAFTSPAPGAFYHVAVDDFGATPPVLVTLTSALLATAAISTNGHVFVETTWITAEGEGVVSNEVSIAIVSATNNTVTVQQPIVPTNGQTVLGWRIYSSYTTGTEKLNAAPDTTNFTTSQGVIAGIALSSNTSATVTIAAIGATTSPQTFDESGIQASLPSIPGNTSVNYYLVVPNSGSQWKQQKSVQFMKADGIGETLDVTLNHLDFIQPVYPGAANEPQGGANPPSSTYTQASVATGTYMVMNGYLFVATQATTSNTATTFIGWTAFNTTKGKTTTDGSVTWTCLGKAGLIRFQFGNVNASAKIPTASDYEIFQL